MDFGRFSFPALLLSVAAHLGLAHVIGPGHKAMQNTAINVTPARTVDVNLHKPLQASPAIRESLAREVGAKKDQAASPPSPVPVPVTHKLTKAAFVHEKQGLPEPRYFRMSELTERPSVAQDLRQDFILVLPDISPQSVIMRLMINDQGSIDRTIIEDADLPEKVMQQLTEAFSNIKFRPGKIGRIAVRSQLRIEIFLESTIPHRNNVQNSDAS